MDNATNLVHIADGSAIIEGSLSIPSNPRGLVLFAHGSGSSRHSPRNNFVAKLLNQKRFATLLMDLLTVEEDQVYETRFDINLLTQRLIVATKWAKSQPETQNLPLGYFGASTGAAAALQAAAGLGSSIAAVVSRGGRPDLAGIKLDSVQSPVLLVVGGNDFGVIELNELAFNRLHCIKDLAIVPHATHLFEEPGTLEMVANLACQWFEKYMPSSPL